MSKKINKVCLVAVDVRSAHNIGSLFRTCDGFGAELFIVGASPRPAHVGDDRLPYIIEKAEKEIAKTALGADKLVLWRYASTLKDCLGILRNEEYKIIAIEQSEQSSNLNELKVRGSTALLVGREVEGLSADELALCDEVYEIEMVGRKESFNVSVAAGIALYQATNSCNN